MKKLLFTLATLSLAIVAFAETPQYGINESLAGYWAMDTRDIVWTSETAGTIRDRSGNNRTGTLVSMVKSTSPLIGKIQQALDFDGTADYINLGNVFATQQDYTYTAWIRLDSVASDGSIIGKFNTGADGEWIFFFDQTVGAAPANLRRISMVHTTAGTGTAWPWTYSNSEITTNRWYFVAGVYDRGVGGVIYIDGVRDFTDRNPTTTTSATVTTDTYIGSDVSGLRRLNGRIDDVRVYTRALSDNEIQQIYRQGLQQGLRR